MSTELSEAPSLVSCPTRLVDDAPAEIDAFGPHRRIAEAVAQLIRDERGGRAAAIIGRWGSGKSTVIQLVRGFLAVDPDAKIWVFDAWAHEGDLLRRAFLESLSRYLDGSDNLVRDGTPWLDQKRWQKRRDELARRYKTSTQTSTPILSRFGRRLALSLFLPPIGLLLANHWLATERLAGFHLTVWGNLALTVAMLMTFAPVTLFVGMFVWHRTKGAPGDATKSVDEALAIFSHKGETRTTSTTLETPEPTSLEFADQFCALLHESLARNERRLVLVIDNLDRVEPEIALSLWSTLQTFFQIPARHTSDWMARVWVVLAFDRGSMTRVWAGGGDPDLRAASFLDKSFQVQFEVPPPLLSDWGNYFRDVLTHVLPAHSAQEIYGVYRLVATHRDQVNSPPTPRELKLIANQIGALHRQWAACESESTAIPIAHMAYYVLHTRTEPTTGRDEDAQKAAAFARPISDLIRSRAIPTDLDVNTLGADLRENLGALAFGVVPSRARQILIEGDVERALSSGDAAELSRTLQDGAGSVETTGHVLERMLPVWATNQSASVFRAVTALDNAGLLRQDTVPGARMLARLIGTARSLSTVELGDGVDSGILALAVRAKDPSVAHDLFKLYGASSPPIGPAADARGVQPASPEAVEEWVVNAARLAIALRGVEGCANVSFELTVPGEVEAFVDALNRLSDTLAPSTFAARVVPEAGAEAATDYMKARVTEHTVDARLELAIRYMHELRMGINWSAFIETLKTELAETRQLPETMVESSVRILRFLQSQLPQPDSAVAIVEPGVWASRLAELEPESDAAAYVASALLDANPSLQHDGDSDLAQTGSIRLRQLLRAPPEHEVLHSYERDPLDVYATAIGEVGDPDSTLWQVFEADPETRPWIERMLKIFAERSDVRFFQPSRIAQYYDLYTSEIPSPSLFSLAEADQVAAVAREAGFVLDRAALYTVLIERVSEPQELARWVVERLRGEGDEVWLEEILANGEATRLANACAAVGVEIGLGEPVRLAIRNRFTQLLEGEGVTDGEQERLLGLFEKMAPAYKEEVTRIGYELISENASAASADFFAVVGGLPGLVEAFSKDRGVRKVIQSAAEARHLPALQWLGSVVARVKAPLKGLQAKERELLVGLLDYEAKSDADDEAHVILGEIGRHYGVHTQGE